MFCVVQFFLHIGRTFWAATKKKKNFFALASDLSAAFHGALPEILTMGRHCKAARSFVGEWDPCIPLGTDSCPAKEWKAIMFSTTVSRPWGPAASEKVSPRTKDGITPFGPLCGSYRLFKGYIVVLLGTFRGFKRHFWPDGATLRQFETVVCGTLWHF